MKVKLIIICIIYGSLTLGCRSLLSSYESEVTAEVTAHHWRRTVVVEQLETKTDEAWEDELPKDVKKIISKRQAIHHYNGKITKTVPEVRTKTYKCGEEKYGLKPPYQTKPKYCEYEYTVQVEKEFDDETKPGYATKIKYEIEVWTKKETKDFSGYDKNMTIFQTKDVENKTTRLGKSDDVFTVELKTPDGEKIRQNVAKEIWEKLNEGQKIKCKIDLNKTLSDCEF